LSQEWKGYWPILERLEHEVCELTFAVAFSDDHLGVYSARLAELLLRTCAECENIGKSLCVGRNLGPTGLKVQDFNFPAVGNAICSRIAIHTKQLVIVWPYQSFTATSITPFDTWRPTGSTNPIWFNAYNGIKHDRIANATKANVGNVIHALGGLFLLNLWPRDADITQHSEHINLAQMRIASYSRFFSPARVLKLESRNGLSGPMSGSNLRNLVFDWQ
jgi:hypothetical protein